MESLIFVESDTEAALIFLEYTAESAIALLMFTTKKYDAKSDFFKVSFPLDFRSTFLERVIA